MVRKPKGVEALVTTEPPPSIEEINLRDWYAVFAMQALIQRNVPVPWEEAYIHADEMLRRRNG